MGQVKPVIHGLGRGRSKAMPRRLKRLITNWKCVVLLDKNRCVVDSERKANHLALNAESSAVPGDRIARAEQICPPARCGPWRVGLVKVNDQMSRLRFRSGRWLRWRHGLLLPLPVAWRRDPGGLAPGCETDSRSFASSFADFSYKFHEEIQTPEVFLATQNGDCDDYATLADLILREKGYTTRLMAVRMPGLTHVVCYVAETKCYLDFNNRTYLVRTVSSGGSLQDVARKVAKSFEANWTSASEFTYGNGVKRLVTTITKTQPYMASPVPVTNPPSPVRIDF